MHERNSQSEQKSRMMREKTLVCFFVICTGEEPETAAGVAALYRLGPGDTFRGKHGNKGHHESQQGPRMARNSPGRMMSGRQSSETRRRRLSDPSRHTTPVTRRVRSGAHRLLIISAQRNFSIEDPSGIRPRHRAV